MIGDILRFSDFFIVIIFDVELIWKLSFSLVCMKYVIFSVRLEFLSIVFIVVMILFGGLFFLMVVRYMDCRNIGLLSLIFRTLMRKLDVFWCWGIF